ncbi:ZP domain-containing protein-like [Montipora foliosa]|uniref:ZP domain-containing protein-like n=1 Tax=Montipora foliosa TaxID=591990 RepID=UPI0035F1A535
MFSYYLVVLMLLGLSNAQNATEPATEPPTKDEIIQTDAAVTTDSPDITSAPVTDTTEAPTTAEPTTPPPDSLSVTCTNDEMMVVLKHEDHSKIDLDSVTLKDTSCKLSDLGDLNGTHLWMKVPFDSCKTNHSTTGDVITYQNSLITETRASSGSILISREFQAEFPFKCSYPRSAVLSVVAFSPRERVVYTKTAEFGNFTFTMDMYKSDQYDAPYDTFPVQLDLNDPMYLEVKVTSSDSKLVLIPLKCWGTPSPDLDDDKYYAFIEDGCKEKDDPTIVFDYMESNVQHFQLGAFRFMGESVDTDVYLHCDVEACRKGDNESRCAKGCEDGSIRKRRDLVRDFAESRQEMTIGPIKRLSHKEAADAQSSVSSLTVFAAVAGILGVVVLALAVALVMLYRRYRSPQNAPRVVYTKAAGDEGKLLV